MTSWRPSVFRSLGFAAALAGCAPDDALPGGEGDPEGSQRILSADEARRLNPRAYAALPEGANLGRPFEALFAPDDPVATLELTMIRAVRSARRTDGRTYADGDNPFRVRYAVYNLTNPDVVRELAEAAAEGVDVQVLVEADQIDPARPWNTVDEDLAARGFEVHRDHARLTAAERRTADLVGITGRGLMHLKTRLYETPMSAVVLSGSYNPGDSATANEENLHLIRDPRLVARYRAAYESVLAGRAIENAWDDAAAVNVMFTPEASGARVADRMLRWIEDEREQVLLMVFSLRDLTSPTHPRSLVELLTAKAAAGVPVYVITDRKQSDGVDADGARVSADDRTEDRLRAAGVHVYEATNRATPFTAMHHKVAVLGRARVRVITDAANWSQAALGSRSVRAVNQESVLFVDSARLDGGRTGRRYLAQWLRVLSRYAAESARLDREAPFADVHRALTSRQGWPSRPVTFAVEGTTSWGEQLFVRGSLPELGAWNAAGHALTTDAQSYPRWRSATPFALPLGTPFEWKLVAAGDGGANARWERGDNRADAAIETPLVDGDAVTVRGSWRP